MVNNAFWKLSESILNLDILPYKLFFIRKTVSKIYNQNNKMKIIDHS